MKKISCVLLCIFLLLFLAVPVSAASAVPEPVMQATNSVVRILAKYSNGYGTGSGFVIKSDDKSTLIATNYHVVTDNPHSISVWIGDNETISATILAYTDQKDMCILELAYPVPLKPLTFANDGAQQGDAVYAVGFPSAADILSDKEAHTSADSTITDGIVSAVRKATVSQYGTPTAILQINAAINPGNSGGPLFNSRGEVVGINTYGITDSQGIFGAIDISELKAFLEDSSVSVSRNNSAYKLVPIFILVISITVIVVIIMLKKKHIALIRTKSEPISLQEFMVQHPDGIGMNDAVSMLLPVALQLRDMHNNGTTHLQVSPNSIVVGSSGANLVSATTLESDRYTNGFAAPEIYKGKSSGMLSDVYSFCAVLSYVASGNYPENALSRLDSTIEQEANHCPSEKFDSTFAEIIGNGMALRADDRIKSMQDVIIAIAPYNTKPFTNGDATPPKVGKLKVPKKFSTKTCLISALIIFIVLYSASYLGSLLFAKNGNLTLATKCAFIPPITKLHDPKLASYIEAGTLMEDRKYDEAKAKFENLSGYLDADEFSKEADYRHAAQLADANKFDSAFKIYSTLSENGYKDAKAKVLETKYRKGVYCLYEKNEYTNASNIFSQLSEDGYSDAEKMWKETQYRWACAMIEKKNYTDAYVKLDSIRGYSDVNDLLPTLTECVYLEGQKFYREGKNRDAKKCFDCIPSYRDSKKYLTLIDTYGFLWAISDDRFEKLMDLFYFENTAEMLLFKQSVAEKFLLGTWRGEGHYFTMDREGSISYSLPYIYFGDYYEVSDGDVLFFPEDNMGNTKQIFHIEAITPDCIEVFCFKNNKSYTLYRQ